MFDQGQSVTSFLKYVSEQHINHQQSSTLFALTNNENLAENVLTKSYLCGPTIIGVWEKSDLYWAFDIPNKS